MGSITEAIGYINAKPEDLTKVRFNMSHISETNELKEARKKALKARRLENK